VPRDTAKPRVASLKPLRKQLSYSPILTLGAGGMGEVTLAVKQGSPDVKKLVVLKTLRRDMLGDESIRRMFLEEACLSARLSHPNVVQVFNVISNGAPILVMEYLDGKPMSAILSRAGDRCSIPMQLRILSCVLSGLHYSHELRDYDGTPLKLVHRDVSPHNVIVTYDGLVKVLDFGLAKVATKRSRTKSGTVKGKLEYMPVEQMMGGEVDRRADIYAVGCMLWHACAGERLWADANENSIVRSLITGNIPRPSTRRPVDARLEAMTMKALAFDPKHRYQTALEFQEAIEEYLRHIACAPSSQEIAEFVSGLFEQERRAMADVIRMAMTKPQVRSPSLRDTDENERTHNSIIRRRTSSKSVIVTGMISAVLVVAAIASLRLLIARGTTANAHGLEPRDSVTLRVAVVPSSAVIVVDNWPTHENPATLRLSRDSRAHEIRAALTGYESVRRLVHLEQDLTLDLVLQPTTAGATSATTPSTALPNGDSSIPRQRKATATRSPSETCDPPYYYRDGLKYFKRSCL
jgi:serine/threonine protein kinase